jgi:hypothetical protein
MRMSDLQRGTFCHGEPFQETEDRRQETGDRRQKAEDKGVVSGIVEDTRPRRAEAKRHKTGEDRRQETEDRSRRQEQKDRSPAAREPPRDNEVRHPAEPRDGRVGDVESCVLYLCRLSAELLAFALRPGGSPEAEGSVLPEPCDIEPS